MADRRKRQPGRAPLGKMSDKAKDFAEGKESPPERYTETLAIGRKRRKDATGQKKDYHKGTQTLAVRLPDSLAAEVRARAKAEGLSVNAWLAEQIEAALK